MHVFGLWEGARLTRRSPHSLKENMQTTPPSCHASTQTCHVYLLDLVKCVECGEKNHHLSVSKVKVSVHSGLCCREKNVNYSLLTRISIHCDLSSPFQCSFPLDLKTDEYTQMMYFICVQRTLIFSRSFTQTWWLHLNALAYFQRNFIIR